MKREGWVKKSAKGGYINRTYRQARGSGELFMGVWMYAGSMNFNYSLLRGVSE